MEDVKEEREGGVIIKGLEKVTGGGIVDKHANATDILFVNTQAGEVNHAEQNSNPQYSASIAGVLLVCMVFLRVYSAILFELGGGESARTLSILVSLGSDYPGGHENHNFRFTNRL